MIARNKDERPANCKEVIAALEAVGQHASAETPKPTAEPARPAWLRPPKSISSAEKSAFAEFWRRPAGRWTTLCGLGSLGLALAAIPFIASNDRTAPMEFAAVPTVELVDREPPEPPAVTESVPDPAPEFDRTQFRVVSGNWRVEGSELLQTDSNEPFPILVFGDKAWQDYEFTVDMMRVEGKDQGAVGFRVADGNFYMFGIGTTRAANQCYAEVHEGSDWSNVGTWEYQTYNHNWYTIRVRLEGDHVQCFLKDGDTEFNVFDFSDNRFGNGCVALRVYKSAFRFRNIKVTSLDGKVLWEGMPALP